VGAGGRATSDHAIIGEGAWRFLKAFKFDPKELRGIGIQITRLEHSSTASGKSDSGQGLLAFTSVDTAGQTKANGEERPSTRIQSSTPPSNNVFDAKIDAGHLLSAAFELPSLSQVDMEVLEALPADLRQEVEAGIQWRSRSPVPGPSNIAASATPVKPEGIPRSNLTNMGSVKGKEKEGQPNLKRITQQLAPRNRPVLTQQKCSFFEKREADPMFIATDAELRKLDIDPSVFAVLPVELQKEQLAMARRAWNAGGTAQFIGQRKPIKPYQRLSRSPSVPYLRRPLPKAKFLPRPTLKQQGKRKGERIHFSETEDVQNIIEKWVFGFRARPPNEKDVRYFEKYLVECIQLGGDAGIDRAIKVAKWWLLLLRRHWGDWEDKTEDEDTKKSVGYGWWTAFREVKGKMDIAARERFGGTLSLK
jgi:DNA repair protein REV1